MSYLFTTPTQRVYRSTGLLTRFFPDVVGRSVLKVGTSYRIVDDPSDEQVHTADIAYLGGRIYVVTDDEAEDLTTAGYGPFLTPTDYVPPIDPGDGGGGTPTNPTDPPEYGAGAYGSGLYGS